MIGLAVVTLAGCDLVFKLEPAPDASPLGACPFLAPVPLPPFTDNVFDPSLRGDALELWFSRGGSELFSARRAALSAPFEREVAADTLNTGENESDPAPTADGLRLFYSSGPSVIEARRASQKADFTTPIAHADLPGQDLEGLDIAFDGLRIYYDHVDGLRSQARVTLDTPFLTAADLGPRRSFPSISHDERELFFQDNQKIYRVLRANVTDPFDGTPELILDGVDPEISDSGKLLVFKSITADGFAVSERTCVDR